MKKITTIKPIKDIKRYWHFIDLEGQTLGRISTKIAKLLTGKDKVQFCYHHDWGDYVIAVNSNKIKTTGKKLKDKIYYRHSGYAGNLKEIQLKDLMKKDSRKVIYASVYGMVAKNKLRKPRMRRLKIFKTADHPYQGKLKGLSPKRHPELAEGSQK
ncbi:50S ribosomal protein L13 [Patescibacteria group bacterium]|nr:50S ribosomal protein L13 [Patescibacteria group bacterium]MCG2702425.1 50S ribosomal protein L13 [Candidatus Parcubacteria bacterium]MBU4264525.1 50S ribosomal protein L13 [Patescibacteria group bacterium]MBU4390456.1 50S ribosomal protein L13 [Patescibacteria group bacterium]MBU4397372.1 50S ribosomal protein L13 [Patescibacteria group bacterium]